MYLHEYEDVSVEVASARINVIIPKLIFQSLVMHLE
jgi:hypothetical protein